MSILEWPSELTKFTRTDYQLDRLNNRYAKPQSLPGYKRKTTNSAKLVTLGMILSRDQKAVFDAFFDVATQDGSKLFYMPDPATDGYAVLHSDGRPLLQSDGKPLLLSARWLCLFGETLPVERTDGDEFAITFEVAVMP